MLLLVTSKIMYREITRLASAYSTTISFYNSKYNSKVSFLLLLLLSLLNSTEYRLQKSLCALSRLCVY